MGEDRLIFLAFWVRDLERSAAFYRDALGIPLHEGFNEPVGDPWIDGRHFEHSWREGAYLHFALFPVSDGGIPTTGAEISFTTADADATHAELAAKGVPVVHEPRTWASAGLRIARYRDPDGNIAAFTERL
ncbi:MAG TPA: VOC family protein [Acidimicrobiia bacterium]|nr:VOC family protein [Acidimicrobiia bacterium]